MSRILREPIRSVCPSFYFLFGVENEGFAENVFIRLMAIFSLLQGSALLKQLSTIISTAFFIRKVRAVNTMVVLTVSKFAFSSYILQTEIVSEIP